MDNLIAEAEKLDRKKKKKRGKPEKACPECNYTNHARSSNCKECNYEFYIRKKKKQELLAANWRELKAGDIIKCVAGHGSYYLSNDKPLNPDGSQQKIPLGHRGKFQVVGLFGLDNPKGCGIIGRQVTGRGIVANVREYIYMGETYYDDDLSTHKEPHKIKVLKND
tara:strand:+ start:2454 stop:2951 length:498 start_codon:yes stop_codon:yes gene_type:complete